LDRSGTVTQDGVLVAHAASLGASLFDTNPRFEFHLPWEFQGGAAYVRDCFELELDLLAYTPVSAYSLISTNAPLVYGSAGPNVPPSVMPQPFPGLTSESKGVVNVGVGGHVRPLQDRDLRVHGSDTANNITLRNLLNGETVNTSVAVHVSGLIYSLAYQF
jgi:hypothetical protein